MNSHFFVQLLLRDIKGKYAGYKSMWIWVFIEPLVISVIMYTVFRGMGKADLFVNDRYALYFFTGYFSWILVSLSILESTSVYRQYAGIFKKNNVDLDVFPFLKLIKYFIIYIFLNVISVGVMWEQINGFSVGAFIFYLLIMFFMVGLMVYVTAILSSLSREIEEMIKLFIRFGLWILPVIWVPDVMSEKMVFVSQLTPFYFPLVLLRKSFGFSMDYGFSPYSWLLVGVLLLMLAIRLRKVAKNILYEVV